MRITSVRAWVLEARPEAGVVFGIGKFDTYSCVLVEVLSDDGTAGYGEAIARRGPQMTKAAVESLLADVLIGEDPYDIEGLWVKMLDRLRRWGHSSGVVMEAISGADIALWDLVGKHEGKPVWQLLLGAGRSSIPVYASSVYIADQDVMISQAKEQIQAGFEALKIKIGRSADPEGMKADVEAVAGIREALGADVDLMVDANGAYDGATAVRICRALEPLDLAFFEEPLPPDDMRGYERLHSMTAIPLARGETDFSLFGFNELLTRRLIDYVQPDIARCGGITGARHVYTLAFANNIALAPHTGFSGGLSQLAAVHVSAAALGLWRLEYMFIDNPLRELFVQPFPPALNGALSPPSGPGLGMDLDMDTVERFTVA